MVLQRTFASYPLAVVGGAGVVVSATNCTAYTVILSEDVEKGDMTAVAAEKI